MPDPIFGTENDDTINSGYESDMIFGNGGNDTLNGGWGADMLIGGLGADTLNGGENQDMLQGDEGNDTLDGGTGSDTLMGGAGADTIRGGAGDDMIMSFMAAEATGDVIDGGSGVDTFMIDYGTRTTAINFQAKDPILSNAVLGYTLTGIEQYNITGGIANDVITGYLLSDFLNGGGGSDVLNGRDGFDFLDGGAGNDTINAGNDGDFANGDVGNDILNGDGGDDFVQGGTGADKINGGNGNDTLSSTEFSSDGLGDRTLEIDTLSGNAGNDFVEMGIKDIGDGGTENDIVQLDLTASAVAENFVFSNLQINLASGGSFKNFETLYFFGGKGNDIVTGGANGDHLNGGAGLDTLKGGAGDDMINGEGGNDIVYGMDGNDMLTDDLGADRLYGDAGDDMFFVGDSNLHADRFEGGIGRDTIDFTNDGDLSAYVDLTDQTKNDGLTKGDIFRLIETFIGSENDDFLFGDQTANTFYGSDGDDVLDGRAGNDVLHGGEGSDTFTGGAGNDIFDISDQEMHGAWFGDIFTDFTRGQDKIRVSLEFLGLETAPEFSIVSGNNPVPTTAGPQLLFDQVTDRLWFDQDGTGGDHEALLIGTFTNNVATLTNTDFVFI